MGDYRQPASTVQNSTGYRSSQHHYHPANFGHEKFNSVDVGQSHLPRTGTLTVTLNPRTAGQSFRVTLQLMVMHQHTKSGRQRLFELGNVYLPGKIWADAHGTSVIQVQLP